MVSVFFRCNCPYAGYMERKIDYVNREMIRNYSKDEMTNDGYRLFNSSGSYMILAKFEGRKYFHSRQSRTSAVDDQNRPVRNDVVFVGSGPEDDLVISKLAGYALLNESNFYKEIASMITLLEGGYQVDYDKLQTFLNRFTKNFKVRTTNHNAESLVRNIVFRRTNNDIDFVVLEADMDYLNKQLLRVAKAEYMFSPEQMREMEKCTSFTFAAEEQTENKPDTVGSAPQEAAQVQKAPAEEAAEEKKELPEEKKEAVPEAPEAETPAQSSEQAEGQTKEVPDSTPQDPSWEETDLIAVPQEKSGDALKKAFVRGLITGIIGTLVVMLLINLIF